MHTEITPPALYWTNAAFEANIKGVCFFVPSAKSPLLSTRQVSPAIKGYDLPATTQIKDENPKGHLGSSMKAEKIRQHHSKKDEMKEPHLMAEELNPTDTQRFGLFA